MAFVVWLGDWTWILLYSIYFGFQLALGDSDRHFIGHCVASFAWFVLSILTENRELFFPFSIYLASSTLVGLAGKSQFASFSSCGSVLTAFLFIRIGQDATNQILLIEMIVAASIMATTYLATCYENLESLKPFLPPIASFLGLAGLLI